MAVWAGSVRMVQFGRMGYREDMGLFRLLYVGDLELADVLMLVSCISGVLGLVGWSRDVCP
jgi:hypothetical protein